MWYAGCSAFVEKAPTAKYAPKLFRRARFLEESAFCRFYTIAQPLPSQATATPENRLEKGIAVQAEIFGEGVRTAWQKSHINR